MSYDYQNTRRALKEAGLAILPAVLIAIIVLLLRTL